MPKLPCSLLACALLLVGSATLGDTVTVGGRAGPNTPGDVYWQRFLDAATRSNGPEIRLLIRGEIGPEQTLLAGLRRGRRVQLASISTTTLSQVVPELDVLRLPFLFEDLGEAGYILDNHLQAPMATLLLEHNLVMIQWQSAGWLNLYAKVPIVHPNNIAQRRIRINASPAAVMFMEAVDADIVPISFAEIVPGLQTGLIDGGEQSTQLFLTGGMGKFAPHYSRTQHAFITAAIIANRSWFEGLTESERQLLTQALPTDSWYRDYFSELNVELLKAASAEGLTIHELSDADREAWRERTANLAADLIADLGPRAQMLYDTILEGKAAYAELD